MEDWQGCLGPACQGALQCARDNVIRRGGYAVTLEDFFLAMLDEIPELSRFLGRQGVDLDELTRTIQCEQPIVTEVASENLLSSQLVYWFCCSREIHQAAWLEWPMLFHTLVQGADRLREKAYVAVLEPVSHWPCDGGNWNAPERTDEYSEPVRPVVIADSRWAGLTEDICVHLSSSGDGLAWVAGERGSGKSSWLETVLSTLPGGAIKVNIRRESDVMASDQAAVPADGNQAAIAPTLILDNVSPADLLTLMGAEFSLARELVTAFPGPIMLLSEDSPGAGAAIEPLEQQLGRRLTSFPMVAASSSQKLAILTAHQPFIEKRWHIEFAPGLSDFAATSQSLSVQTPGQLLQWVEAAAARLHLFAERGPLEADALAGQADTLRRQSLLAMARQQPVENLDSSLAALSVERAALEVAWHERKREGSLRLLRVEDLRIELERRVAARNSSGHYGEESGQTRELELA